MNIIEFAAVIIICLSTIFASYRYLLWRSRKRFRRARHRGLRASDKDL